MWWNSTWITLRKISRWLMFVIVSCIFGEQKRVLLAVKKKGKQQYIYCFEVSRFLYQSPFKLMNNFIFPSVWVNERLTSTCQNCEISIRVVFCYCSAELVSCSLNKFVGNAKVLDISNFSEI